MSTRSERTFIEIDAPWMNPDPTTVEPRFLPIWPSYLLSDGGPDAD